MTEAEWLACNNPDRLLEALDGKWSERKWRLTAFGFCRMVWHILPAVHQRLVEVAERHVDGLADAAELSAAREVSQADYHKPNPHRRQRRPDAAVWIAWYGASHFATPGTSIYVHPLASKDRRSLAAVLHDLFDNLFRPAVVAHSWLTWNGGIVSKFAQVINDDRRFFDLPILADALEEAGCTDTNILDHCRQSDEHVRGCWVVDLLLGKA